MKILLAFIGGLFFTSCGALHKENREVLSQEEAREYKLSISGLNRGYDIEKKLYSQKIVVRCSQPNNKIFSSQRILTEFDPLLDMMCQRLMAQMKKFNNTTSRNERRIEGVGIGCLWKGHYMADLVYPDLGDCLMEEYNDLMLYLFYTNPQWRNNTCSFPMLDGTVAPSHYSMPTGVRGPEGKIQKISPEYKNFAPGYFIEYIYGSDKKKYR